MTIATEVAKVEGWRIRTIGRGRSVHDISSLPPETQRKPTAVRGKTFVEFLDDEAAWARRERGKILANIKENRCKKKDVEIREETTGQFYKRYRDLCQKRIGGSQEKK